MLEERRPAQAATRALADRREFLRQLAVLAIGSAPLLRCASSGTSKASWGDQDAVALARLVQSGEVTPLQLVEEALRRIGAVDPQLNAVVQGLFDPETARSRARGPLGGGPLAGVPVLLKNLTAYRHARIDDGSRLYARAMQEGVPFRGGDAPVVEAMERTGMIIVGLSNSPERGLIDSTEPVLHGPTLNPWDPDYSTGGSSGGAGAAVAAGLVPLAHGSDGGGSIRIPASHCGVFGLKPTRGREVGSGGLSGYSGPFNIVSELSLSRSVRDTAAFLSAVERRDNPDLEPVGFVEGPSASPLRIAVVKTGLNGKAPHAQVEESLQATADLCRQLGHQVAEARLPLDGPGFLDAFIGFWAATAAGLDEEVREMLGPDTAPEEVLEPWTLGLMRLAARRGLDTCRAQALFAFSQAGTQMEGFFQSCDVLLTPVLRHPPHKLGWHSPTGDFETILERVFDDVVYTPLQNAAGMPAMSVPLYWTPRGLPIGSHFSAWRGNERMLLHLAYQLEEARPWKGRRPPINAF